MTQQSNFWSRRKAAVQAEHQAEVVAVDSRAQQAELAEREARPDAEILAELDLPDPDALSPGDDVAGFMARAVPDRLRRRALRKLWTLNPVLANLDGLVDYGEDFTLAEGMTGKLQTSYQVGKGLLAHLEEMARQAEATPVNPVPAVETDAEPAEALASLSDDATGQPTQDWSNRPEPDPATGEPEISAPAPRRMRFAFEG